MHERPSDITEYFRLLVPLWNNEQIPLRDL